MRVFQTRLLRPAALLLLLGIATITVGGPKDDALSRIASYKDWTKVTLAMTLSINEFSAASVGG